MTVKTKIKRSQSLHHKHKPKGVNKKQFEKVYWPYLPVFLVAFSLIVLGLQSGGLQAAMRHPTTKVLDYATSMSVGGLLSSTNSARASNGISGLSINSKLNAAAQAKANDMATRNYWSHNTPEGNPPWVFVNAQGYAYQKLGENLAAGFNSEQSTINGWMASAPHRENLLNTAYTEVGFGYANNPNYTSAGGGPMTIVVAFYGQPQSVAPPAAQKTIPPASPTRSVTPPPSSTAQAPAAAQPSAVTSPAANPSSPSNAPSQNISNPKTQQETKAEPVTTDSRPGGVTLSFKTSRAQLAFARLPVSNFATGLTIFIVVAASGFWISKHLLAFRRVFVSGERYIFKHPMLDLALLGTAVLAFLLTQTAGFII